MSDNVNSVVSPSDPATDLSTVHADEWLRLFWLAFRIAETIASNGDGTDPSFTSPNFEGFLFELEDHVLDQVALTEDLSGASEHDAVRQGARAGYIEFFKTGHRRSHEVVNLHASGPGGVSGGVYLSDKVASSVPDQDHQSPCEERLFHLGLGAGSAGCPIEEDGRHSTHEEAGASPTPEKSEVHPEERTRMLSALITLGHACQELAREVAHPDQRVGHRLAAEVAWVTAWRECKAAYLSMDRWGDDNE